MLLIVVVVVVAAAAVVVDDDFVNDGAKATLTLHSLCKSD